MTAADYAQTRRLTLRALGAAHPEITGDTKLALAEDIVQDAAVYVLGVQRAPRSREALWVTMARRMVRSRNLALRLRRDALLLPVDDEQVEEVA